jgi:hypothetical protein
MSADPQRPWHRRQSAAEYLRTKHGIEVAVQTLAKLACIGGGPRFAKFGRFPMYAPADLDAWAKERMTPPLRSTSDKADAQK